MLIRHPFRVVELNQAKKNYLLGDIVLVDHTPYVWTGEEFEMISTSLEDNIAPIISDTRCKHCGAPLSRRNGNVV